MDWIKRNTGIVISLFLLGCGTTGNKAHLGKIAAPPSYSVAVGNPDADIDDWLADFGDTDLRAFVAEAQEHNFDLQISAARLMSAFGLARIDNAGRYPTISGNLNAARNKRVSAGGFALSNNRTDTFDIGLGLAWEVDLWGKLANRSRAATADAEAAQNDFVATQFSIAANTTKLWFALIEAEMQLALATKSHAAFRKNLDVVEQGFNRGVRQALDVRLTRANVASAEATMKARKRERDEAARSLEVLLGRYPADEISVRTNLPEISRPIPGGIPSNLLQRRPDLRAAERRLAATDERNFLAKKNRWPTLSLTANGGTSTSALEDLLDPDQNVWRLAAGLTQPIFRGGQLAGERKRAEGQLLEQVAIFSSSVLTAFQEVENALANEVHLREQETALRTASIESVAAEGLAWEQYNRGLVDIITVLDSQRRAVTSQSSLYSISRIRLQNRVDLYLALGGDFEPSGDAEGNSDK
jgi:outer membrane protein, multidrug efflux system